MKELYKEWGNSMEAAYEEEYFDLIQEYCQYKSGSVDKREARGRTFHAGYEMYIYAFFLGLYIDIRTELKGPKKAGFRMPMNSWGYTAQRDRDPYPDIQKYIFAALVAKTDIDLIAIDKGEVTVETGVKMLMKTLQEYANTGFKAIMGKLNEAPDYFRNEENFFNFIMQYARG